MKSTKYKLIKNTEDKIECQEEINHCVFIRGKLNLLLFSRILQHKGVEEIYKHNTNIIQWKLYLCAKTQHWNQININISSYNIQKHNE
jgi:hypothetical protein